jgi:hypothetical protein
VIDLKSEGLVENCRNAVVDSAGSFYERLSEINTKPEHHWCNGRGSSDPVREGQALGLAPGAK